MSNPIAGLVAVALAASMATASAASPISHHAPPTAPHIILAHGGHSLCANSHRHDWEGRKIRCHPDEYIFRDGPLPLPRERKKPRRTKKPSDSIQHKRAPADKT